MTEAKKAPRQTVQETAARENPNRNSSKPRANLKTDKTTYTRTNRITVDFSFEGIEYSEGYRIDLVLASRQSWSNYSNVGETGTQEFKPQSPGDYEIRAFINTGSEWVQVEKISIKVTSDL